MDHCVNSAHLSLPGFCPCHWVAPGAGVFQPLEPVLCSTNSVCMSTSPWDRWNGWNSIPLNLWIVRETDHLIIHGQSRKGQVRVRDMSSSVLRIKSLPVLCSTLLNYVNECVLCVSVLYVLCNCFTWLSCLRTPVRCPFSLIGCPFSFGGGKRLCQEHSVLNPTLQ